jgi:putative hydrolase of the HAD superfamily
LTRAVIWDFDETLARRSGGWRQMLVDALDLESPGHDITAADVEPGLRHGFPWHDWERPHPELSDPDCWWANLRPTLQRALEHAGAGRSVADAAASRARSEYVRLDRWSLFPDTVAALERLGRDGWRQAILSNHCPELPDLVAGLGIGGYFDVILTSASIGFEKPHPEAYACALRNLGRPRTVWMVGDSPEVDIAGARRCGIPGVLVRRPAPGFDYVPDLTTAVAMIERASTNT